MKYLILLVLLLVGCTEPEKKKSCVLKSEDPIPLVLLKTEVFNRIENVTVVRYTPEWDSKLQRYVHDHFISFDCVQLNGYVNSHKFYFDQKDCIVLNTLGPSSTFYVKRQKKHAEDAELSWIRWVELNVPSLNSFNFVKKTR